MRNRNSNWRTDSISLLGIICFVVALAGIPIGYCTFEEAKSFLMLVALPLLSVGFKLAADQQLIDNNNSNNSNNSNKDNNRTDGI